MRIIKIIILVHYMMLYMICRKDVFHVLYEVGHSLKVTFSEPAQGSVVVVCGL